MNYEIKKTNQKRNLIAVNIPAYVWRVHAWGMGENHNYIPCWYVIDKDTNEIILGGFNSGNNFQSGSAYIPRRKDAKAFIQGFLASDDDTNPHADVEKVKVNLGSVGYFDYKRTLKGADKETEAFWESGKNWHNNNFSHKLPTVDDLR